MLNKEVSVCVIIGLVVYLNGQCYHVCYAMSLSSKHTTSTSNPDHLPQSQSQTCSKLFQDLMENFQGDFDNFEQVVSDRAFNLTPGSGGGHEHIHCTLIPQHLFMSLSDHDNAKETTSMLSKECHANNGVSWVLAAYYFDGLPDRIFRFRLYELLDGVRVGDYVNIDKDEEEFVLMKLYTLTPSIEGQLRDVSSDPLKWWGIIESSSNEAIEEWNVRSNICKALQGCEVVWKRNANQLRHSYLMDRSSSNCSSIKDYLSISSSLAHAFMVNESVEIDSQMAPGTKIRIKDELSLWNGELLINDRGFDLDGNFVYGNQCGVPYRLIRVSRFEYCEPSHLRSKLSRSVVQDDLAWTLGPKLRTEEMYRSKIAMVGGITTRLNSSKI